ncbi:MAG TPA: cob(I)yrinic acid a,c-diamide adenosyltransferase [Acidimicrobiia bacterium]|nr:cob(I)yrinic acid a,c-diamide adenosyltransferase [Acidimicrobiia bacterium]
MKISTGRGDDGTTGLLFGGRVAKDDTGPEAYGTVDEAVSALGVARSLAQGDTAEQLLQIQRDLFVAGAELATAPGNRGKLEPGATLVDDEMIGRVETWTEELERRVSLPPEFVVPGGAPLPAALDMARAVVRRAERRVVSHLRSTGIDDSRVVVYLNRLADFVFMLARAEEGSSQLWHEQER